jgi:predicted nuclease of predicted toxin-antitoxin system
MRILLDEHIDPSVAEILEQEGFQVSQLRKMDSGVEDEKVVRMAKKHDFVIVTRDTDFLRMEDVFEEMPGIVKVNGFPRPSELADSIEDGLNELSGDDMVDAVIYI